MLCIHIESFGQLKNAAFLSQKCSDYVEQRFLFSHTLTSVFLILAAAMLVVTVNAYVPLFLLMLKPVQRLAYLSSGELRAFVVKFDNLSHLF